VDFALDVIQEQLSEEERAAADFARKLVLLSECKLLVSEISVNIGFPRAFSRAVLERHMTDEARAESLIGA
jgi:hypothetical protein